MNGDRSGLHHVFNSIVSPSQNRAFRRSLTFNKLFKTGKGFTRMPGPYQRQGT